MINNLKIISVILARGGSKGLPKKNIYELKGVPLIQHTINHCLDSRYIDKIVVSTDDDNIKKIASKYCEVIDRPDYLSGDESSSEEAIIHVLSKYKYKNKYDFVLCPQVTHPVRREGLVDISLNRCIKEGYDSLLTVKSFSPFFLHIDKDEQIYFNKKTKIIDRKMRQKMEKEELFYYDIGNLYITKVKTLIERRDRIGVNPTFLNLNEMECVDIHGIFDMKVADLALEEIKNVEF